MNIVISDSYGAQRTYNIDAFQKEFVSFGRQPDNDIVLNYDFISRVHGVIYREGNDFYIEDTDSTNGIYVNGKRVKKAKLQNGTNVIIARSLYDTNHVQIAVGENVMVQQPAYGQGVNVNIYNQMPRANVYANMKTNRSMVLFYVFTFLTFGIYSLYFFSVLGSDVNFICEKRDGKRQMNYLIAIWLLGSITLGIVPLVWHTTLAERIGMEAKSRGINTNFNGGSFWLWDILGCLIIIGPFVYMYKLCKVMNMICEDYNQKGF